MDGTSAFKISLASAVDRASPFQGPGGLPDRRGFENDTRGRCAPVRAATYGQASDQGQRSRFDASALTGTLRIICDHSLTSERQ
jgi:hypothetical protein